MSKVTLSLFSLSLSIPLSHSKYDSVTLVRQWNFASMAKNQQLIGHMFFSVGASPTSDALATRWLLSQPPMALTLATIWLSGRD